MGSSRAATSRSSTALRAMTSTDCRNWLPIWSAAKWGVIATGGGVNGAKAARAATTTIPIVFEVGADPVEEGLVASLNRPGGNLTGVTALNLELDAKRLGLLCELVPGAARIGVLVNPSNSVADKRIKTYRWLPHPSDGTSKSFPPALPAKSTQLL